MLRAGGRTLVATSNAGALMRVDGGHADARHLRVGGPRRPQRVGVGRAVVAGHGAGRGAVEVSTRSGNTPTPDEAWSEWSAPYTDAEGSPIASPSARYLQWRARADRQGRGHRW